MADPRYCKECFLFCTAFRTSLAHRALAVVDVAAPGTLATMPAGDRVVHYVPVYYGRGGLQIYAVGSLPCSLIQPDAGRRHAAQTTDWRSKYVRVFACVIMCVQQGG
jgi:hypothetical protein